MGDTGQAESSKWPPWLTRDRKIIQEWSPWPKWNRGGGSGRKGGNITDIAHMALGNETAVDLISSHSSIKGARIQVIYHSRWSIGGAPLHSLILHNDTLRDR